MGTKGSMFPSNFSTHYHLFSTLKVGERRMCKDMWVGLIQKNVMSHRHTCRSFSWVLPCPLSIVPKTCFFEFHPFAWILERIMSPKLTTSILQCMTRERSLLKLVLSQSRPILKLYIHTTSEFQPLIVLNLGTIELVILIFLDYPIKG